MKYERITAADVQVGDQIAERQALDGSTVPDRVVSLNPGAKSVYITLRRPNFSVGLHPARERTHRIRPRYSTKLWRVTE